ncbi:MAG: hypothetical protein KGO49_07615 [Gammaproteobacteria bacterium]|nr:hypothetical protein [Gammaproteobacteria bacterium]
MKNKMFNTFLVLMMLCGLTACGQADHEPQVGEYGTNLVNSILLTPNQLEALNVAVETKPKPTEQRPGIGIGFKGDAHLNPYRFVIVVKGTAIHDGPIELKWMGGVQNEKTNGYHPEIYQTEDSHHYHANDPVLLVISSDPFSVSEDNSGLFYSVSADLIAASNIKFQSVEVQSWQGKASKFSFTSYLKFLVILMVIVFGVYRVISVRR